MGHPLTRRAEKEPEGKEIASFECKASSAGASWSGLIPSLLALFALFGSQAAETPSVLLILLLVIALISVLGPLLPVFFLNSKARVTITEGGIRLKPLKQRHSTGRFLRWREISHFSSKPLGTKGGRVYLYPKKPFSLLRRWVIETLNLSDYQLLYNHVSSRVGIF